MTGKDLFIALGFVEEEIIAEAAQDRPQRRVIPMHTVRWMSVLAACICLLIGWAFAAQWMKADNTMCGVAESSTTMTAGDTREESSEEAALEEGGAAQEEETGEGADVGAPMEQDGYKGAVIDHNPQQNGVTVCMSAPGNGEVLCSYDLQKMMERNPDARFLVTFRLYRDGAPIDAEDGAYQDEAERLGALGCALRLLPVETAEGAEQYVCGLLTAEQLRKVTVSETYGCLLGFLPANADGTRTSWDDPDGACITVPDA